MRYILDTNVVVDHIRDLKLIQRKNPSDEFYISIITTAELMHGAFKSRDLSSSLGRFRRAVEKLGIKTLFLDEKIVLEYSQIRYSLEKVGKKIEDLDLLIGATARANNLTLLTNNLKHFQRIKGLKVSSN